MLFSVEAKLRVFKEVGQGRLRLWRLTRVFKRSSDHTSKLACREKVRT